MPLSLPPPLILQRMVPSDPTTAFARFSRLWSEPWLEGKKEIDVPGKRIREREERRRKKKRRRKGKG